MAYTSKHLNFSLMKLGAASLLLAGFMTLDKLCLFAYLFFLFVLVFFNPFKPQFPVFKMRITDYVIF